MNITIENPYALFAIFLIIPYIAFSVYRYSKIQKLFPLKFKNSESKSVQYLNKFKFSKRIKITFFCFAWIFIVFAFSGISWGTTLVPVQKSSNATALVFDISYSMLAEDAPGNVSRLDGAKNYAENLIEALEPSTFSVILAKGDGMILIPQTEDTETIYTSVKNLSPKMMTAAGSSLGKGIRAAIRSFSQNVASFKSILIFTDGDETDGQFSQAISEAISENIPVTVIGFGSEREIEILSGDGKTPVKTALRTSRIEACIAEAVKKSGIGKMANSETFARYTDASEAGSALKILRFIKKDFSLPNQKSQSNSKNLENLNSEEFVKNSTMSLRSLEIEKISRRGIFLILAIISVCASIFLSEIDIQNFKENRKKMQKKSSKNESEPKNSGKVSKKILSGLIIFSIFSITSCSKTYDDGKTILKSSWAWYQQNYKKATSGFYQVLESSDENSENFSKDYALFGLATTYMSQKEYETASLKYSQISANCPENIKFAAAYNLGVIAFRQGNFKLARKYFYEALLIQPQNLDAKVNFELSSQRLEEKDVKTQSQTSTKISGSQSKNSGTSNAIFSQIKENEENQWKSQNSQNTESSVLDY